MRTKLLLFYHITVIGKINLPMMVSVFVIAKVTLSSSSMDHISVTILSISACAKGNAFTVVSLSIVALTFTPSNEATSIPPLRIK